MRILLEDVYKKVVIFLHRRKYKYLIIGGIAAGTLGEPRVTGDVDVDINLSQESIVDFLDKAKKAGFKVSKKKCVKTAAQMGTFQINYGYFHIDFIVASTDFEEEAFKRRQTVRLYGIKAFFPTPEDLILLKIIPGRKQDLVDAEKVILRHKKRLDMAYLQNWARKLCDQAEDMRIWNDLNKLLKDRK
jgi:predicted nucleotidyltransferase